MKIKAVGDVIVFSNEKFCSKKLINEIGIIKKINGRSQAIQDLKFKYMWGLCSSATKPYTSKIK